MWWYLLPAEVPSVMWTVLVPSCKQFATSPKADILKCYTGFALRCFLKNHLVLCFGNLIVLFFLVNSYSCTKWTFLWFGLRIFTACSCFGPFNFSCYLCSEFSTSISWASEWNLYRQFRSHKEMWLSDKKEGSVTPFLGFHTGDLDWYISQKKKGIYLSSNTLQLWKGNRSCTEAT